MLKNIIYKMCLENHIFDIRIFYKDVFGIK